MNATSRALLIAAVLAAQPACSFYRMSADEPEGLRRVQLRVARRAAAACEAKHGESSIECESERKEVKLFQGLLEDNDSGFEPGFDYEGIGEILKDLETDGGRLNGN